MKKFIFFTIIVSSSLLLFSESHMEQNITVGAYCDINKSRQEKQIPTVNIPLDKKYIGPGSGGATFSAAFMPQQAETIIFGGDMGAMFRTENMGKEWNIIGGTPGNQPGIDGVWSVMFDKNASVAWSVGNGVYKSTDSGKTWKNTFRAAETIGALGIDPLNGNIVYVAEGYPSRMIADWVEGRVWKTIDGGKKWTELSRPGGNYDNDHIKHRNYSKIIVDPTNSDRIYLGGRGGFYKSEDAGETWNEIGANIAGYTEGQIGDIELVIKNDMPILFAALIPGSRLEISGIFKSDSNGKLWTEASQGLERIFNKQRRKNKATKKDFPLSSAYTALIEWSPSEPNRLYLATPFGIAKSENLGLSWMQIVGTSTYGKNSEGDSVAILTDDIKFKKSLWGGIDEMNSFIANKDNADMLLFGDNQDLYLSKDGAKTWESITFDYGNMYDDYFKSIKPSNRYKNLTKSRGIQNIVSDKMTVDPFDSKIYYAAYMDLGIEISRDGGEWWEHPTGGIPARGHAWDVATNPKKEGEVWCSIEEGQIYKSINKGKGWSRVFDKESAGNIKSIALDTVNGHVYLATKKEGVYTSADGGLKWKHISDGLKGDALKTNILTIDPNNSSVLYLGTLSGLYKSTNSGQAWSRVDSNILGKVDAISVGSKESSKLFICANPFGKSDYWDEKNLWSLDVNGTLVDITPSFMKYAGAIAVNPFNNQYLYAATKLVKHSDSKQKMLLVRSKDGGKTWKDIGDGIALSRVRHITIDQKDPQHLFVYSTFGVLELWDKEAPTR